MSLTNGRIVNLETFHVHHMAAHGRIQPKMGVLGRETIKVGGELGDVFMVIDVH